MKIKFNSDDDLPLNKPLTFRLMTITIRCVSEEDCKLYPQAFLDDTSSVKQGDLTHFLNIFYPRLFNL